mmetsp:Transcript_806/g.2578  ORF Transcript_806/g.2578 Transcript_806/m.2578 type:complete len:115 (-) Transcript_806:56-400(-)
MGERASCFYYARPNQPSEGLRSPALLLLLVLSPCLEHSQGIFVVATELPEQLPERLLHGWWDCLCNRTPHTMLFPSQGNQCPCHGTDLVILETGAQDHRNTQVHAFTSSPRMSL